MFEFLKPSFVLARELRKWLADDADLTRREFIQLCPGESSEFSQSDSECDSDTPQMEGWNTDKDVVERVATTVNQKAVMMQMAAGLGSRQPTLQEIQHLQKGRRLVQAFINSKGWRIEPDERGWFTVRTSG